MDNRRPTRRACSGGTVGGRHAGHPRSRIADAPGQLRDAGAQLNGVRPPAATKEVDWEAELGVIIGRTATRVAPDRALDHVAGYVCCNDLSARDLQRRGGQWTRGKAIDGFLPMGPYLVTPDEVRDPQSLRISSAVNGELVQDSSTSQMVFGVAELISVISQTLTLERGDVIVTGTPPGVGLAMDPPRFLKPGDEVVVEIERIGRLTTTMA